MSICFIIGIFIGFIYPDVSWTNNVWLNTILPLFFTIWPLFATIIALRRSFGINAKTKVVKEDMEKVQKILISTYISFVTISILITLANSVFIALESGFEAFIADSGTYGVDFISVLTVIFCIRYIKRFFKEIYQD